MKIKELVKRLSEFDEESEIEFEAWSYKWIKECVR